MSVGEKLIGFFIGLLVIAVGCVGFWGLILGMKALATSMSKEVLGNFMLGLLALPLAYGFGVGIMANRQKKEAK